MYPCLDTRALMSEAHDRLSDMDTDMIKVRILVFKSYQRSSYSLERVCHWVMFNKQHYRSIMSLFI